MNFYVILFFWICPRAWVTLQTYLWDLPLSLPGFSYSTSWLWFLLVLTDMGVLSGTSNLFRSRELGHTSHFPTRFVLVETELNVIHLRNFMEPDNHQPIQGYPSFLFLESDMFRFMFLLWFCDLEGDPHPIIFA